MGQIQAIIHICIIYMHVSWDVRIYHAADTSNTCDRLCTAIHTIHECMHDMLYAYMHVCACTSDAITCMVWYYAHA